MPFAVDWVRDPHTASHPDHLPDSREACKHLRVDGDDAPEHLMIHARQPGGSLVQLGKDLAVGMDEKRDHALRGEIVFYQKSRGEELRIRLVCPPDSWKAYRREEARVQSLPDPGLSAIRS